MKDGIKGLPADARYPDHPTGSRTLTAAQTSDNDDKITAGCVTKLSGLIVPNITGEFTFMISADGSGELWLSTDTDPANKKMVCKCPAWAGGGDFGKYPQQTSQPVTLHAGQKYYIEALQQGGGGNGNVKVAWDLPGLGNQSVISGPFLSSR